MNFLVAYDVAHPRRLNRIARIMKDYGRRVQKSVFEISVTERQFREMKRRVDNEIDPGFDGVKFFPACERCCDGVIIFGENRQTADCCSYLIT